MVAAMKRKRKFDGRKLDHKILEALRIRTVQRVVDGGDPEELDKGLGMNRATVYRWIQKYYSEGRYALKAKPIPGRPPKLDIGQKAWLARTIREKNPLQLNFQCALWTVPMLRELIRRELGVRLSQVSVWRLLRNLGFTPQRPKHKAHQQVPALVERWRAKDFTKIQRRVKKEKALIFFADEAGIRSDDHRGTTWAPIGETSVVASTGSRFSLNMLSVVSPREELRLMVYEGTATAQTFCTFLERLAVGVKQKIFLIAGGHRFHRARKVKECLERLDGKIELFFLPPYTPQLNANEWVWSQVRGRVGRQTVHDKIELTEKILSALRSLQKLPDKIRGFFRGPDIRYAMEA